MFLAVLVSAECGCQSGASAAIASSVETLGPPPAESAAQSRPETPTGYYSKFGDQVLSRSQTIVKGRVVSVESATAHSELVTLEVEGTFKGEAAERVVVLANRGEYFEGSELLVFLSVFEEGPRFTCFNRVSLTDADYEAKERHLVEQLEIEALTTPEDRRRKSRELLLQNVRSEVRWTRWNALRGLAYVLERYEDMVRDEDVEELRRVADSSDDEEFRTELLGLLENHGHDASA